MSAREDLLSVTRKVLWKAWASSSDEIGSVAAEALLSLGMLVEPGGAGELERLRKRVAELEQGPALPWAHAMSDHDLHEFLGDLVSAAMGRWQSDPEVPDRTVLANVEKACAAWRTPGKGSRLDGSGLDGVVRLVAPVQVLREGGEFHEALHHDYRVPHDLPEPGGVS